MNPNKIYKDAMELWGLKLQMDMVQEECGECVAAINRLKRGRIGTSEMIEEIVDVHIMIEQMRVYYPLTFDRIYKEKMTRLEGRIEKAKEELNGKRF